MLGCALAALLFAAGSARAQPVWVDDAYLLDRWGTADGLPVAGTTAIHLSPSGYLWLATFDGLVRFDGHRFVVFNTSRDPALPGNRLVGLIETADGALWTTTEHGALARFHGDRFQAIGRDQGLPAGRVLVTHLDPTDTLWVGTRHGLARRMPPPTGRGSDRIFRPWAPAVITGAVRAVVTHPDGRVWVGIDGQGVLELEGEELRRRYTSSDGLPSNRVRSLALDASSRLWIGTADGIARVVDGEIERFAALNGESVERIDLTPSGDLLVLTMQRGYRWSGGAWQRFGERDTSSIVDPIHVAPDGEVWTVDQEILARDGRKVLEAPCVLNDVAFDPTGAVWLATACDGLWRLRRREVEAITAAQGLPEGPVYGMAQTADGTLWAASAHGTLSEIRDGRVAAVHRSSYPSDTLRTLLPLPDGRLWVGHAGLCLLDDGDCEIPPDLPEALRLTQIRALHETRDGSLWVGSLKGLWRRDATGWRRMDDRLRLPESIAVRAILEARSGNLWFATVRDGLRRLTRRGDVLRRGREHGLASAAIRDLYEDERGHLWVATEDRGVCRSRTPESAEDVRFDCLGEAQGLHSASLHRILPDGHGRLWFNSNRGVFWVERAALERVLAGDAPRVYPRVYTERDGLPDREGNGGVQGAGVRLADGRLAFPGQGGIAIFDPRRVRAEARPPRVVIESLVLPGGREIPARPRIELPRGERVFSVRFTGLTPGLTDPHYFRYRMPPTGDEWTELGTDRLLSFQRMPPGRHTLELVGIDAASGATGEVARMRLILPAAFYETGAFRAGLLVALVAAAGAALAWQRRQAGIRRRRLEREVDSRTAEIREQQAATEEALATVSRQRGEIERLAEARTRFFANVSHELRTPLTLLLGPLRDQTEGDAPAPELADAMLRNAHRLERLVEQLLDLERIDAGRFPLRLAAVDLARVARDGAAAFAALAEREGIGFEVAVGQEAVPVHADPDQMSRVIGNLLSNAFKFTPRGGRVRLALAIPDAPLEPEAAGRPRGSRRAVPAGRGSSGRNAGRVRSEARVELVVEDTGPGVPPQWQERIFDRFSQMGDRATRAREGSGLGLSLCREVVGLHGGALFVEPANGGGSRFVLQLPPAATAHTNPDSTAHTNPEAAGRPRGSHRAVPAGRTPAAPHSPTTSPTHPSPATAEAAASEALHAPDPATPTTAAPNPPPTPSNGTTAAALPGDRRRVLVAEDHPDLRRYIETVLATDYDVETVEDGDAALAAVWREPPDVIVSDIVMPRRDGFGLARALRAESDLAGIPLIFLTARAGDADEIAALAIGADQYLRKPFQSRVLKAHVAAALRACQRLRDQLARQAASRPADDAESQGMSLPERVRGWIEANAHEESLSVDELAAALYMSRRTLHRRLIAATGMSPSDYIRAIRLSRARRLLQDAAGTVSEVAYAVGFNSLSAFSRAYRSAYGEPPSQHLGQA